MLRYLNPQTMNDKAAIMQIKELKEPLNGECDVIGFSVEEVKSMRDICID